MAQRGSDGCSPHRISLARAQVRGGRLRERLPLALVHRPQVVWQLSVHRRASRAHMLERCSRRKACGDARRASGSRTADGGGARALALRQRERLACGPTQLTNQLPSIECIQKVDVARSATQDLERASGSTVSRELQRMGHDSSGVQATMLITLAASVQSPRMALARDLEG